MAALQHRRDDIDRNSQQGLELLPHRAVAKALWRVGDLRNDGVGEWTKTMRYDALEQDLERAQYKLFAWCQRLGLRKPFETEYFMVRTEELAWLPIPMTTAQ